MSVSKLLAGVATVCCVFFGTASTAASLTLAEFDRLVGYQKENFISTVLHFEYYRYNNNPDMAYKADCMVELDRSTGGNDDPYLLSLIMDDLDSARAGRRHDTVEGLIKAVIDRECKAP